MVSSWSNQRPLNSETSGSVYVPALKRKRVESLNHMCVLSESEEDHTFPGSRSHSLFQGLNSSNAFLWL